MNREEAVQKNLEGQKLLEAGQYDEAIKLFSEAIEIDANYAAPWLNRSDAKRKLGREAEADADKEKGESLMRATRPEAPPQHMKVKKKQIMKKPINIVLGVVTLWPIIYMVMFSTFVTSQFLSQQGAPSQELFDMFDMIFRLHLLTMLVMIGLLIFYIANIFRNDRVAQDKKALWAVAVFLGNVIAMPIYWYLYIWREPKETIEGTKPNTS